MLDGIRRRRAVLPDAVRARLPLSAGEKVLAAAEAEDGTWVAGSRDALLVLPAEATGEGPTRVPWQQVQRADWDRDTGLLRVSEVGEFGQVRPSSSFDIAEPGRLLELVRERVTATVVLQRRVTVPGGRGLFVVARRAPHGRGEVTWAYEFDPGVDPEDPAVRTAAEQGLARAAEELGL